MKYIFTFIMIFFIGFTAMAISVDAFSFQQVDIEDVPYMKSEVVQAYETLQAETGFTDNYYIILSYSSSTTFNVAKCSFSSSDSITLANDYWGTPSRSYTYMCRINSSNPVQISNRNWNNTQVVFDFNANNNYLIANTIPVVFNGNTYDVPEDQQADTFFVSKDGFTSNFGVYAGPASEYVTDGMPNNYFQTKTYTVKIELQYNNSTISYTIPNYLNWAYKYNTYVRKNEDVSNVLEYIPKFTFYAEPIYKTTMQAIRVPVINEPSLTNLSITDFADMTDYRSFNQISFAQMLTGFQTEYPNLILNDLYTELHFKFYDMSGKLCYDGVNDFSSLKNSGIEPEDDPYITNLTQTTEQLNNYLTSNNKYLQDILYGDTYIPAPYEITAKDAGSINLDVISMPDYSYTQHTMNTDATSFFGRLVEWWYLDTPFGIIATVALTLLVIKVIIW